MYYYSASTYTVACFHPPYPIPLGPPSFATNKDVNRKPSRSYCGGNTLDGSNVRNLGNNLLAFPNVFLGLPDFLKKRKKLLEGVTKKRYISHSMKIRILLQKSHSENPDANFLSCDPAFDSF